MKTPFAKRPFSFVLTMLLALGSVACGDSFGPDDDDDGPQLPPPPPPAQQRVTNFDMSDLEGWSVIGPATPMSLSTIAASQPFSGRSVGTNSNQDWWFLAPMKFRGDLSGYYGGSISYQYRYDGPSIAALRSAPDIRIRGGNGLVLERIEHRALQPARQWRDNVHFIRVGNDWTIPGRGAATESEIRQVLSNVQSIEIRGSRRVARDEGLIDVVLLLPPA